MKCDKKYRKIPCKGTMEVTDAWDLSGRFDGFNLQCPKCGHVAKHWDVEDLRQMVATSVKRPQEMPEYSRYRMN